MCRGYKFLAWMRNVEGTVLLEMELCIFPHKRQHQFFKFWSSQTLRPRKSCRMSSACTWLSAAQSPLKGQKFQSAVEFPTSSRYHLPVPQCVCLNQNIFELFSYITSSVSPSDAQLLHSTYTHGAKHAQTVLCVKMVSLRGPFHSQFKVQISM